MFVSGKDESIFSKSALMGTKPGKQIIKQGLFKSKGFKLFNQYKQEAEDTFPAFAHRFAKKIDDDSDHIIEEYRIINSNFRNTPAPKYWKDKEKK